MKINTLTISAFGPFAGIETIDFTQCNQAGLFRLGGATGAGKSTILDAIMFALYGETTGQGQGKGELDGRGAGDLRCTACAQDDETFVTLDFETHSARYRVRRTPKYQRMARRGRGLVSESATATLEQCFAESWTPRPDLRGVESINRFLEQELGLTAEQFRRVIMIPQGRFREVLISTADAREELLKKIFGTDVYERFAELVRQRARDTAAKLRVLADERDVILRGEDWTNPTDLAAVRAEAVSRQSSANERKNRADREVRECDTKIEAFIRDKERAETANKLLDKVDDAAKAAEQAQRAFESIQMEAGELAEARRVAAAARALEDLRSAEARRQKAEAEFRRWSDEVAELWPRLEVARNDLRETNARVSEQMANLHEESGSIGAELTELDKREQQIRTDRERLARIKKQLAEAEREYVVAEQRREDAIAAEKDADRRLKDGLENQRMNRAAMLAQKLTSGCACPVCGSLEHPFPAVVTGEMMSDSQIEELEEELRRSRKRSETAAQAVDEARLDAARLRTESDLLNGALAEIKDDPEQRAEHLRARRDAIRKEQARLNEMRQSAERTEAAASKAHADADKLCDQAQGQYQADDENLQRAVALERTEFDMIGETDRERVRSAMRSAVWIADVERRVADMNRKLSEAKGALASAREAASGAMRCDLAPLDAEVLKWSGRRDEARRETETAGAFRDKLTALLEDIADLAEKFERAERKQRPAQELEQLVGGGSTAGRVSLHAWMLGAFLDEILTVASRRMHELTRGRYELHRMSEAEDLRMRAGLGIEVFDTHAGSRRPARTLSGGETFLASLSMALALGEVAGARGGRTLDTVFIDEGFGTLDAESLELAMDVLARLRDSGRTIGLISHVDELRRRIPTGIEVVKDQGTGISRIRAIADSVK